ncbi:MAG: hybrid sensor histidine kinase/response regulator [Phenylobacterium sp.]|uniref:ATP-binding response regulator n=1 Tax=Phenylobacterium sp. TaxID=1871053 RepID=UPI001A530B15|nr:hybrid sensor histidine kinase/response regulator [Phenylobacterium sp.]MBL8556606.1 hybrid sensor histidine kinase/response regulator [Phenylobacterium sp.]
MSDEIGGERPSLTDIVRAEQVRLLYADGSTYFSTMLAAATLGGILIWEKTLTPVVAAVWLGFLAFHTAVRLFVRRAYFKADPPVGDWARWGWRATAGCIVSGLTWAAVLPFLLAPDRFDLQALVLAAMVVGTYGVIGSAGSFRPALYSFFVPFLSVIPWLLLQGDTLHIACAVLLGLWLPSVAAMGRRFNASLEEALTLRFENAALADDLRAQKSVAEQSSLAKSRFLAAASHDLRQPVHALGMFIGAMRSHRLPRRTVDLVDQMDVSIAALDGLFGSLLDISRLDAGVIESKPVALPVQPLLARICRELEPEAEAKGIDIVLAPTTAWVRSDPVLLERVMRNLIGNAARYTQKGWIIVGCRRRGRRFCLEVRDTGPGIPTDLHEAVFEEFYQVGNPDRDRAKGLGLGLPIVKRLTAILDHPLEMESRVGEGTTFRVLAPRAAARAGAPVPRRPAAGDLRTGFILAIDDEQAIRAGMTALLESWGHVVIAAPGGDAGVAALKGRGAPDLVICDYRLRDGESGLEAVRKVRASVGVDVPAIIVTGETSPERLRQAQDSGHLLLHKPLSHARLRAAVTNLIRRKAAPAAAE